MNFQTASAKQLNAEGFTITKLPTRKPSKANTWANAIKGGSTRVRTHGGATGSRATSASTSLSALGDVR